MRHSRFCVVVSAALAALSAGVFAQVPPGGDQANRDAIMVLGDPSAGNLFLADDAAQARLKASDPALYKQVFAKAAEMKDIGAIIQGEPSASAYRQGFLIRDGCDFCQTPSKLLEWTDETFPLLDDKRRAALRTSLLEWNTLDPELTAWLGTQGLGADSWKSVGLTARQAAIKPWADGQVAELMRANPGGFNELSALHDRAMRLDDILPREQGTLLWDRLIQARSAVRGLDDARKRLEASGDPALKALLAQARDAGDLETRLTLLGRIFDGLGAPNPAVLAAAPPRAGQVFDADARRSVADLLKSGIMREVAGTWAGADLAAFYANHTLDLRVGVPTSPTAIGQYHPGGEMVFNEEYIQRFLKTKGRDIRDLSTDPALLRSLTVELTPLFVHESTHQRQFQWASDNHIHEIGSQNIEVEAMETEALFVAEKSLRDPSFLALLKEDAKTPGLAAEAIDKARVLNDGGAAAFRDEVNAEYYPDSLSLEGDAWKRMKEPDSDSVPTDYAAFRARLQSANALVEDRLKVLLADQHPSSRQTEVPAPPR
jgi:hypothetical protein